MKSNWIKTIDRLPYNTKEYRYIYCYIVVDNIVRRASWHFDKNIWFSKEPEYKELKATEPSHWMLVEYPEFNG